MGLTSTATGLVVERGPAWHRARLARPDLRNVVTPELIAGINDALTDCEQDQSARALVLEGSDGIFCDGMDLAAAAQRSQVRGAGGEAFVRLLDRFTTAEVVVISQVDGRVTGGGVGLVAASDFVFATGRSSFSLPEALWGLVPCLVAPYIIRRAGYRLCRRLTLSTMPIDADTAADAGLVDAVEELPARSLQALLNRLRRVQPASTGTAKRYLNSLQPIDDRIRDHAMDTLEGLLGTPAMVQRLRQFADHQQLPWQQERADG